MKPIWIVLGILVAAGAVLAARALVKTAQLAVVVRQEGPVAASGEASLEITYIANEGVLVSDGERQVLIDGLHREYEPAYAFLPEAERGRIEQAAPPFDRVDLVLVSHLHLDHFHPESVGLHLKHNPAAVLVSSRQVVDEIEAKAGDYRAIGERVVAVTPLLKERVAVKAAGVEVSLLGLGHGSGRHDWVQNLGHLVELGGKKVLHLGDAVPSEEIFEAFDLDEEGIDVAFIPFWFLTGEDGSRIVREHIKPEHIIAVHISPENAEETAARIRRTFPEAIAFTTLLEKTSL